MKSVMDQLTDAGVLRAIDSGFARSVCRLSGEERDEVVLAAAIVSSLAGQGHTCADLNAIAKGGAAWFGAGSLEELVLPEPKAWLATVASSPVVGSSGDYTPLILDEHGRLYLFRYWDYQRLLAGQILERAVETAQGSRLMVISGGPGTGKTYTVARILAQLIQTADERGEDPPRVLLVAPTGKAAARLRDSIAEAKRAKGDAAIGCERSVIERISEEALTVHRALRWSSVNPTRFFHNAQNPLAVDVVVADEASMIDLALMTKLVEAVPGEAKLILIGDKDQLASVEAGAVLGDICNAGGMEGENGRANPELSRSIVHLVHNYRFGENSGIGNLSRAINSRNPDEALDILESDRFDDVKLINRHNPTNLVRAIANEVLDRRVALVDEDDPSRRLAMLRDFGVLCGLRNGPLGADEINKLVEREVLRREQVSAQDGWYNGRPVMITRNDYNLRLFNGDMGILCAAGNGGDMGVVFDSHSGVRLISPARLGELETAFALTVHKSQGSEFDHVALVLPQRRSPVLTAELLYTAVTRARKSLTIYGAQEVLREAILTTVVRFSGLRDMLWPRQ